MQAAGKDELLTPGEVAVLFRVNAKTVTVWAKNGKLASIRTPGGHRRYRAGAVRQLIAAKKWSDAP
jgi:excisionase family DNA binding protein